jgi:hypothetical protein
MAGDVNRAVPGRTWSFITESFAATAERFRVLTSLLVYAMPYTSSLRVITTMTARDDLGISRKPLRMTKVTEAELGFPVECAILHSARLG